MEEKRRPPWPVAPLTYEQKAKVQKERQELYVQMRHLGILGVIEQITLPIELNNEFHNPSERHVTVFLSEKEEELQKEPPTNWKAGFQPPMYLTEVGWNGTLWLILYNLQDIRSRKARWRRDHLRVSVGLTRDAHLIIAGRETIYQGFLPEDELERQDFLEDLIARAIFEPKFLEGRERREID